MKNVNIEIPEGHVIDLEKSSLKDGKVVFKKVEEDYPTSWEGLGDIVGYYLNEDGELLTADCHASKWVKNVFPTVQDVESSLALSQLLQLRKAYIGDWVADWSDGNDEWKHLLERWNNKIIITHYKTSYNELSFQTKEQVRHFLKYHRELIEVYFKIK